MNEREIAIDVGEAIGHPDTGFFVRTPHRAGRKWPRWSLRPYLSDYPNLSHRWDHGGPFTMDHVREMATFINATHKQVSPGVLVFEVEDGGIRYMVSIVSPDEGKGNVSRWLDSLPTSDVIAFPEVTDLKLAQMLHRRGFVLAAGSEDDAHEDDWLPVHVRGTEVQAPIDVSKSRQWEQISEEDTQDRVLMGRPAKIPRHIRRQLERESGLPYMAEGSIVVPCNLCDEPMFLGPRQQEHRESGRLEACMMCLVQSGVDPDLIQFRHAGGK